MHTQGQVIERVIKALPHPDQIINIDVTSERSAVRFAWRGITYRVSLGLMVEEVGNGVLIGSDRAMLIDRLIKLAGG